MAEFYYTKAGERQGPVTRDALRDLVDRGDVTSSDYYWFAGMDEWAVVGDGALPHAATDLIPPTAASPIGEVATQESTATPVSESAPASSDYAAPESSSYSAPAVNADMPSPTLAASPLAAPSPVQSTFGSGSVTSGAQGDTVSVKDIALKMPSPLWLILPAVMYVLAGILQGITIIGLIVAWLPIWLGVLLFQANKALETARVTGYRNDLVIAVEKLTMYFRINGILFLLGLILSVLYIVFIFTVGADLIGGF